jgi:hypothetical protein
MQLTRAGYLSRKTACGECRRTISGPELLRRDPSEPSMAQVGRQAECLKRTELRDLGRPPDRAYERI